MQRALCDEARYLVTWLVEHPLTSTPATRALAALMCLHAARLPARLGAEGELRALVDQDRTRWDGALMAEGERLLGSSVQGAEATES